MFLCQLGKFGVSLKLRISAWRQWNSRNIIPTGATYESEVNLIEFEDAVLPVTVPFSSGWCGSEVADVGVGVLPLHRI